MHFDTRRHRPPIVLNVVALIDISALIIIFLIMGSVFGESSVVIPPGILIPKSVSKETIENAPSVSISGTDVSTNFGIDPVPLDIFHGDDDRTTAYQERLKKYVDGLPAAARASGVLINVVADKKTPYRDIFDVVRHFRTAGFQSILFIAQGK